MPGRNGRVRVLDELDCAARDAKAKRIADEIISLARGTLTVDFRFLDRAIGTLKFVSDDNVSLSTDGEFLYWRMVHTEPL